MEESTDISRSLSGKESCEAKLPYGLQPNPSFSKM